MILRNWKNNFKYNKKPLVRGVFCVLFCSSFYTYISEYKKYILQLEKTTTP